MADEDKKRAAHRALVGRVLNGKGQRGDDQGEERYGDHSVTSQSKPAIPSLRST